MYLNTFLYLFGLDPDNFTNELVEPFESDDGTIIYNLHQRTDVRICPTCGCLNAKIQDYNTTETPFTLNDGRPVIIRIKKVRFKCRECDKTFTPEIKGIEKFSKISSQTKTLIIREFYKQKSFSIIARDYHLSVTEIMRIFDQTFPYIRRGLLPTTLCIDEIGFKTEDGSYASILYDHDKKIVVDVIRNRKIGYLRDYFNHCSFKERIGVKYFISDLYEGYKTIKEEYFINAIHIADMFHVVKLLRDEVSRLRIETYKNYTDENAPERGFMKAHWDYFEKYLNRELAYKDYYCKKEDYTYTTWQMMERCLKLNQKFWDAYACLQDFYEYWSCKDFETAINFIELIVKKLKRCGDDGLTRVAETYHKWRVEIANAITCKNEQGKRYSNGPAEGLNNAIKTIVKDANGYKNFERFRKRILLVLNKRKDLPL